MTEEPKNSESQPVSGDVKERARLWLITEGHCFGGKLTDDDYLKFNVPELLEIMAAFLSSELSRSLDEPRLREIEQRAERACKQLPIEASKDEPEYAAECPLCGTSDPELLMSSFDGSRAAGVQVFGIGKDLTELEQFILNAFEDIPYLLSLLRRSGLRQGGPRILCKIGTGEPKDFLEVVKAYRANRGWEEGADLDAAIAYLESNAPASGAGMVDARELVNWLEEEALQRMKSAIDRRDGNESLRNASESELRSAKSLAQKMMGRKFDGGMTTKESAAEYADMQDRIASKLEAEARKLSGWADLLRSSLGLREEGK